MTCFSGIFGAKAVKFYTKSALLTLCLFTFILIGYSGFLTAINATLFTNSVLDFSWRTFCNSGQHLKMASGSGSLSRETGRDYTWLNYPTHQPEGSKCKRFPACIIFGVSKCGTRALLEYLTLHPDVVAPNTEVNFFCNKTLLEQGIAWYIEQMPFSMSHQITVEKSPDYFQFHYCADLIYAANNSTKLLLLLRDPVERLVSQYMQLSEKHPGLLALEKWVINPDTNFINTKLYSVMDGAYSEHLFHWLHVFPRNQIHIIESDSLRVNPLEEMKQVEKFLNLKPFFAPEDFYYNSSRGFYCTRRRSTGKTKCLGKSKGRPHVPVDRNVLDKLRLFYKPYNDKLNKLLGLRYPWS